MRRNIKHIGLCCILLLSASIGSHSLADERWLGVWQAEETPFTLRVELRDEFLYLVPVETLGFVWRNSPGRVQGDSAAFNVEYHGVLATILVRLGASGTAIARPTRCQPDYHFVCALVQNQQAIFHKLAETAD